MSPTSHNNGWLQQKNILLPQYAQKKDMTSSSKANQPKDMVRSNALVWHILVDNYEERTFLSAQMNIFTVVEVQVASVKII